MISENAARDQILASLEPLAPQSLRLESALGRHLARDLRATLPLPPFDNSSMDGYAVRAADVRGGAPLRVIGEQPAGVALPLRIGPGEAIRIFTGAPIPQGADAVVMQEDVEPAAGAIAIRAAVEPGENIRKAGADLAAGQSLAAAGDPVTPRLAALLASQGLKEVEVVRQVRAAVLSTGDELIETRRELAPGQIYESNSLLLAGLIRQAGALPVPLGIAPDHPDKLRALLEQGLDEDILIVSGGVSVGDRDLVKSVLTSLGAQLSIWRVAIRPGKPFLFGERNRCCIFGLPGNPVSTFVSFLRFVRPAILKLMGSRNLDPLEVEVAVGAALENPSDRTLYIRGRIAEGIFTPAALQESHAIFALSQSNALLRLNPGETLPAGKKTAAILLD